MRCTSIFAISAVLLFASAPTGAQQQPLQTAASLEAAAKEAEAAGRLKDAFDLYVRAVQALPDPTPLDDDARLRERVVALAARIEPMPVVPEDAMRLQVRGQVLFKDAKDEKGFEAAAAEMRKAIRTAPWVADFAYNLALVQEKLEYYRAAAGNLQIYLQSNPTDADVRAKMYEFEVRRDTSKDLAQEEDCAFGDATACQAVESRRMGVGSTFAVFHQHGRFDPDFLGGRLTILKDGFEFTENASGNRSHVAKVSCQNIRRFAGARSLDKKHLFVIWQIADSRLGGVALRLGDESTPEAEEQTKQDAILNAIRYVCPRVK